jgi:hypothetical protein
MNDIQGLEFRAVHMSDFLTKPEATSSYVTTLVAANYKKSWRRKSRVHIHEESQVPVNPKP